MAAFLGLSAPLLVLFVMSKVLFVCVIALLTIYVVRLVAQDRADHINRKLRTVIAGVLAVGYVSFSGTGMFTNRPLLSEFGYIGLNLLLMYALVVALRWVRNW